jgi:hypothetical protein
MATVNKNFKVKNGLVVDGATATVGGFDVLTKKQADQDYIVSLIGGTATSANTADTVVKRDGSGNFAAGTITANLSGNVTGNVTGTVSDISNHDTGDLAEGTNLYFTNQRAVTANTGLWDTIGAAAAAEEAANDYTDGRETAITNAYEAYADQAEVDAKAYTDTREGAITTAYEAYADQAEVDAKAYTDTRETAITTAYEAYADQAEVDAKAYADQKVSDLVNGAPELLDTLNELAAAINDDASFASTIGTSIGEKVAKSGDTMTGLLVLSADPSANLGAATKQYVDAAESDAVTSANSYTDGRETAITTAYQSYADTAEQDAKDYADDLINDASSSSTEVWSAYKTGTEIGLAQQAAIDHADALDTDDIAEGSAQYFTDARAKSSAASLLTGASLTNITITGTGEGLTITAENGVADSDTDDLDEGTTNLYFTNTRAVDALEAVVPNFTAVELNSVAKQVAATLSAPTAGVQIAHAFAKAEYRSAEYLVKVAYSTHTEISKVLLTLDSSDNISVTEYGIVGTNGSLSAISATVSGSNVQLLVDTEYNDSTVTVVGTLVA